MQRSIVFRTLLLAALFAGCEGAAERQHERTNAETLANEKIGAATDEAARAAVADGGGLLALAGFLRLREDYRHHTAEAMVELDRRVALLQATVAGPRAPPGLEARLQRIRTQRRRFDDDYLALESASASTWDASRAALDQEWSDLVSLVDAAAR